MCIKNRDIILIPDDTVRPPKPKFVVCVEASLGLFYRINTKKWRPVVFLSKMDHPFLDHDSYIESGDPLEIDDYIVNESIRKKGIIGQISNEVALKIIAHLVFAKSTKDADKLAISIALSPIVLSSDES